MASFKSAAAMPSHGGADAALSRFGQRVLRRAAEQPYLLALLIGSLLLSIASFFTTFAGMLHFMPVLFITFCIVFAVQALLFVTSWKIGASIADAEPTPWFTIFVFSVCFVCSVFFSWVALFETINDEELQARTRETRIHRAVEDTVSELQARAAEERRARVEALLDSDVYATWRASVNRLAEEAGAARDVLEGQMRERARNAAQTIATLEQERAGILQSKATAEQRVANAENELARLTEARPALLEKVNRLRGEFDAAREQVVLQEGLMRAEETGGGDDRPAGRGPVWRELRDQRNILAATAETKQRLFDQARADLAAADADIEEMKSRVAAAAGAVAAAPITALEQELERLRATQTSATSDGSANRLDAEVETLRANLAAFATRLELEPFNAAAAQCDGLLETMRSNPDLSARVSGLSCDRAPLAEFMNPIGAAVENIAKLNAECGVGGENTRPVSAMAFDEAVDYGRACIAFAGLPAAAVGDLRGEIDRLVLEEDPNASRFVKTVNAFNGGEKLSYFALAIAAAIDALVLFSGLIGAVSLRPVFAQHIRPQSDRQTERNLMTALSVDMLSDDDIEIVRCRNAKSVLRYADAFRATPEFEEHVGFEITAKIDPREIANLDERDNVRNVLQGLLDSRCATATAREDQIYYIRKGVLNALRQIATENQSASRRRTRPQKAASFARSVGGQKSLPAPVAPKLLTGPKDQGSTGYTKVDAEGVAETRHIADANRVRQFGPAEALERGHREVQSQKKLKRSSNGPVDLKTAQSAEEIDDMAFLENFNRNIVDNKKKSA